MRIPHSDEQLLSNCGVETLPSSGFGEQEVNRRKTVVRLHSLPTGNGSTVERSVSRNAIVESPWPK